MRGAQDAISLCYVAQQLLKSLEEGVRGEVSGWGDGMSVECGVAVE